MKSLSLCAIASAVILTGCANSTMLPKSAAEVRFDSGREGKTGWSSYREDAVFKGASKRAVYDAAKAGLGEAGFALRRADLEQGVVIGEHGMTLHDWNVLAGVYMVQQGKDTHVAVMVEGSKDIGFSGDVTGNGWSGRILKGMRGYLMNQ